MEASLLKMGSVPVHRDSRYAGVCPALTPGSYCIPHWTSLLALAEDHSCFYACPQGVSLSVLKQGEGSVYLTQTTSSSFKIWWKFIKPLVLVVITKYWRMTFYLQIIIIVLIIQRYFEVFWPPTYHQPRDLSVLAADPVLCPSLSAPRSQTKSRQQRCRAGTANSCGFGSIAWSCLWRGCRPERWRLLQVTWSRSTE